MPKFNDPPRIILECKMNIRPDELVFHLTEQLDRSQLFELISDIAEEVSDPDFTWKLKEHFEGEYIDYILSRDKNDDVWKSGKDKKAVLLIRDES